MERFSASLAICAGNSPVTGEFPSQRSETRNFDIYLDLRLNKRLSKNRGDGDLRRNPAQYDVIVMYMRCVIYAYTICLIFSSVERSECIW